MSPRPVAAAEKNRHRRTDYQKPHVAKQQQYGNREEHGGKDTFVFSPRILFDLIRLLIFHVGWSLRDKTSLHVNKSIKQS